MLGFYRWLLSLAPLFAALLLGGDAREARAHEGPPFPLFMDQPAGDVRVSLWADPDIGDARFYVVIESPEGSLPAEQPRVAIWTEPTSGRLPRTVYPAERQTLRNRMQFEAKPYFDERDLWKIGVSLTAADGQQRELLTEVESTPPGFGPWDLAIYLFPFVLLGGLWIAAMTRRRRSMRGQSAATAAVNNLASAPNANHAAAGGAR